MTIEGTSFNPDWTTVQFNGVNAAVGVVTSTTIGVTVPDDATTGKITVTNGSGTATSADDFTVVEVVKPPKSPPTIQSFLPLNGPVGTVVTITGTNFDPTASGNTVTLGGALAAVKSATATKLEITVPPSAATGPITVATVAGSTTTSAQFTVARPPAAPTGVTAIAVGETQINISWTPVANATGYKVYRATTPGVTATSANEITATPIGSPPYSDTGLTTGTAYYYVVTAVDGNGESAISAEVSAVPTTPPLKLPTITSFTPTSGTVGAAVEIRGTQFSTIAVNNTVSFGGNVPTTVTAATATSLMVAVPVGAQTGAISVTTAAGTATSAAPFVVLQPPVAPTNVTATAVSASQINIAWAPSPAATGYHVYRSSTPGVAVSSANRITTTTVAASPFSDSGLTDGSAYYYVVTAVNANGESLASGEVSAVPTTPPPAPPAINSFSPTNGVVGSSVTIAGSNFSAIAANNTVAFGGGVTAVVSNASTTSLTAVVPPGASTGPIVVTTAAGAATSASSFTVLAPPPAPVGVTAIAVSATQVTVNWSGVSGAAGYHVYRATAPGVAAVSANRLTSSAVSSGPYSDTGLTTGTAYYYVVTAVNSNGESVRSAEVSAVPTTPPPAPPVINSFSPTSGGVGTTVNISGSNFSAVAVNNTVAFNGVTAAVSTATSTSLTVSVPAGATSGAISVSTSAGSVQSSASFTVLQPPPAPTGVSASAVSSTQVNISWATVSGATGYNIYRSTTPGVAVVAGNRVNGTPVTGPPYADQGLTTGLTYYYVVTAVGANGESGASTEVSGTPPAVISPPGSVAADAKVGQVVISWAPVAGATSYNIYYTTGTTPATTGGTQISGVTSPYTHNNLPTDLAHNYVVTAVGSIGESAASQAVSATPAVPAIDARLVSGIPQTILESNIEVSVRDNVGAPMSNASVSLNGVNLAYDAARQIYKGYVDVLAGVAITFTTSVNGSSYASQASSQATTFPTITAPSDGSVWPSTGVPLQVNWDPGAPTANTNYGIIIFDTVSISPVWASSLYWNNFISSALANPGTGSQVPKNVIAVNSNIALTVYINSTVQITLGGTANGTAVGSIDVIGADTPITISTQ